MEELKLNDSFQELNEDEATAVEGGFIMGFVLDNISNIFNDVTGIIGTPRARQVNNTAHGVLDIVRSTGRRFFLF